MLHIAEALRAAIGREGEAAYPNECCGILLGTEDGGDKTATALLPIANAREDAEKYHRFVIEPDDMAAAELTAVQRGLDVIGCYHSHPDHPSVPSAYDTAHALPFWSYVIVSVQNGRAEVLSSWQLKADRTAFSEETIA
ncbi:MAG: M67 family metallopeptidase [Clostridiales bacterium]|jgi:proteasome lid subunit RPN8/RPN11|nr:M67 family metallopeptidase [Clostridiales bacterium]